jgi:hypothetical protein
MKKLETDKLNLRYLGSDGIWKICDDFIYDDNDIINKKKTLPSLLKDNWVINLREVNTKTNIQPERLSEKTPLTR